MAIALMVHMGNYLVKDTITFSSCWFSPYLTLIIDILRCAFFPRDESKNCCIFFNFDGLTIIFKSFISNTIFGLQIFFLDYPLYFCRRSLLLRVLQPLSRMLLSFKALG